MVVSSGLYHFEFTPVIFNKNWIFLRSSFGFTGDDASFIQLYIMHEYTDAESPIILCIVLSS